MPETIKTVKLRSDSARSVFCGSRKSPPPIDDSYIIPFSKAGKKENYFVVTILNASRNMKRLDARVHIKKVGKLAGHSTFRFLSPMNRLSPQHERSRRWGHIMWDDDNQDKWRNRNRDRDLSLKQDDILPGIGKKYSNNKNPRI